MFSARQLLLWVGGMIWPASLRVRRGHLEGDGAINNSLSQRTKIGFVLQKRHEQKVYELGARMSVPRVVFKFNETSICSIIM
jgi:hypothetical protein